MDDILNKYRLALLGTGDIANFHYDAFIKAGFSIDHCAAKKNSKRAKVFANNNKIKYYYSDPFELIENHQKWDMILLAIDTDYNHLYLEKIMKLGKPCLIEKPVFTDLSLFKDIDLLKYPEIRVAYNRRYYETIQRAKLFVKNNAPVTCRVELPESIDFQSDNKFEPVLLNSIHGIDLLLYLFGDLKIINNTKVFSPDGRVSILKNEDNDIINLIMNWNSPSNFSFNFEAKGERLEIKPFEISKLYKGMDIIEPTEDIRIRRFFPKEIEEVSSFPSLKNELKPGFYEQALDMKNILDGKKSKISASLFDAYKAQKLTQEILFI